MYAQLLYGCPMIFELSHLLENEKGQGGKAAYLRKPDHLAVQRHVLLDSHGVWTILYVECLLNALLETTRPPRTNCRQNKRIEI